MCIERYTLWAIVLFLSSCGNPAHRLGQNTLSPEGRSQAGNGGDGVRVVLEGGRRHAIGMLERLRFDGPRSIAEKNWLESNRENLIRDIAESRFEFDLRTAPQCPAHSCGCTLPHPGAPIYFSPSACADRLPSKYVAARLLLHEAAHHLRGVDEATADRIAASVLEIWTENGHLDEPHTVRMPLGAYLRKPVFTGELLLSWEAERYVTYSPKTGEILRARARNAPGFLPESNVWADGKLYAFGACERDGAVFSPGSSRWETFERPEILGSRRGARVSFAGGRWIWFGGRDCESQRPLYDGAIYDTRANSWKMIQATSALQGKVAFGLHWTGNHLVAWGGLVPQTSLMMRGIFALFSGASVFLGNKPTEHTKAVFDVVSGSWDNSGRVPAGTLAWDSGLQPIVRETEPSAPGVYHTAWTGADLVVFRAGLLNQLQPDLLIYDGGTRKWAVRKGAAPNVSFGEIATFWTGMELLVVDERSGGGYLIYE